LKKPITEGINLRILAMKKSALLHWPLLGLLAMTMQNAFAGSAIALGPNHQMVVSCGHPMEIAKQRALDQARRQFGDNVRIFGATDIVGYGAIAKARHPNGYGWIIAAALGKSSAVEATTSAIQHCVSLGGTNAKIIWRFRG
jgi:hypothetical protein